MRPRRETSSSCSRSSDPLPRSLAHSTNSVMRGSSGLSPATTRCWLRQRPSGTRARWRASSRNGSPRSSAFPIRREDLFARRRLFVLVELVYLFPAEVEVNAALGDDPDALRRHVAGAPDQSRRDGQSVEDVRIAVADDVLDPAYLVPFGVDDLPARLDHEPRDGIALTHTARPSTSHTGPCVATGYVSESARRISTS